MRGVLRNAGPTVAEIPVPIRHVIADTVHAGAGKMHGQRFGAGLWAGGDNEAGRGGWSITNLVEEAGVKPFRIAGILGVEPLQVVRAGRNGIGFLRPAQPDSGYFILWNSVQIEFEEIIISFAGYLPPEGQTAGADDRGLKRRLLAISNCPALRRRQIVLCIGGFHKPISVTTGDPDQVGGVKCEAKIGVLKGLIVGLYVGHGRAVVIADRA